MDNEQELTRKRKSISSIPIDENDDVLTLSLSCSPPTRHRHLNSHAPQRTPHPLNPSLQLSSSPPPLLRPPTTTSPDQIAPRSAGPTRARRNPTQGQRDERKSDVIPQPYPWATTRRATVHSLAYLASQEIKTITGDVQCKRCEKQYKMELDLRAKFDEVGSFIAKKRAHMHDRAPAVWMNPVLPACRFCEQENSVKPVILEKKKTINWLFLLLGQMLGCCTLEQLKYFCKHTKNHRTGAKDRVLYLTYLTICKQLDPVGPFDR